MTVYSSEREHRQAILDDQSVTISQDIDYAQLFSWCREYIGEETRIHPVYNILYGKNLGAWYVLSSNAPVKIWVNNPDHRTLLRLTWR